MDRFLYLRMIILDELKEIIKIFQRLSGRYDLWTTYSDFLEMMAISISNTTERVCNKPRYNEREQRYMDIAKKYKQEELAMFAEIFARIVCLQDSNMKNGVGAVDILGSLLMQLELGSKWNGQFFTPDHLAKLLSDLAFDNKINNEIRDYGFVTANDEAVGGGVTMLALVNTMIEKGYNPQRQLLVVCGDLDRRSCYMTFIQLAMLGIPTIVKNQDALTQELMDEWISPAFYIGKWQSKLKNKDKSVEKYRKSIDREIKLDESGQDDFQLAFI